MSTHLPKNCGPTAEDEIMGSEKSSGHAENPAFVPIVPTEISFYMMLVAKHLYSDPLISLSEYFKSQSLGQN